MGANRFEGLDGLRGIAALAVLVHHAGPRLAGIDLLPKGYLAVDFFFMLSGFVMASAYEAKFRAGLELRPFLRSRIKRLYPMMAIGIIGGAIVAIGYAMPWPELSLRFAMQMLWLPLIAGSGSLFLLDGVQWSLFFEVSANMTHNAVLWRLRVRRLLWIAAAALCLLIPLAWYVDGMGLGDRGTNFFGGFPRVMFSYVLGIIIFRLRDRLPRIALPAPLVVALVPAMLLIASLEAVPSWLACLLVVAASFPVILIIGVRARSCLGWAGWISYPLYAVHLPIIYGTKLVTTGPVALAAGIGLSIAASFVLAWLFEPRPARSVAAPVVDVSLQPATIS